MDTQIHKITRLGDLVVAAYDKASLGSTNPRDISRQATQARDAHAEARKASNC